MRTASIIACLAALASAGAEDQPTDVESTRDAPAPVPAPVDPGTPSAPRERPHALPIDSPQEYVLIHGIVGAGSERRFDGVLVGRRNHGDLVDGWAGLTCRGEDTEGPMHVVRSITATVGTDRIDPRAGRVEADAAYVEQRWRARLPMYRVEVGGGYSQDRRLLLAADAVAGIFHLAASRDDHVRTYRIGGALLGRPDADGMRLTIDRVVGYVDGHRYLATEARLRLPWRLSDTLFLYGEGAHLRHGRENGRNASVWEGWFGVGVVW
jgi:hypothetical protein